MATSPLLLSVDFGEVDQFSDIRDGLNGRPVIDWGKGARPSSLAGVKYALVWEFEDTLFEQMPDLEVIFSSGAGVDKILAKKSVPKHIPIVRFVDETLTNRMSEWVCLQCLMHFRQQRRYDRFQQRRQWSPLPQVEACDVNVGVMGMGVLGQDCARKLKALGFNVTGWSRSKKQFSDIPCYDKNETEAFLSQNHIVVGLLPYTDETHGFFDRVVFKSLARHKHFPSPVFINAGRGGSQNEDEIVSCLEDGTLGGVSLDVFESEPLSPDSRLWQFDHAILTPHVAANSDIVSLGRHVAKQIKRYEAGEGLQFLVDRRRGY